MNREGMVLVGVVPMGRKEAKKIGREIAGYIGWAKLGVRSQADARVLRGKALLSKASGHRVVEGNRAEVCADAPEFRGAGNAGQIHKTKGIEFRGANFDIPGRRVFFCSALCRQPSEADSPHRLAPTSVP